MKPNSILPSSSVPAVTPKSFRQNCADSCKKVIDRLEHTRRAIFREFKDSFTVPEHALRLALNEAEALAWQTGFPQLFFPALATEKAQAAVAWQQRNRVRRGA